MGFTGALFLAIVRLAGAQSGPSSEQAPLSEDELALLASLTSTPTTEAVDNTEAQEDEFHVRTLARSLAEALDSMPSAFRTYRGRDHLVLIRDGVRLPTTHSFARLQDGWLSLSPHVVNEVQWSRRAVVKNGGLGLEAHIDSPDTPQRGWVSAAQTVARTADRGLGASGRVGFGQPGRGFVLAGQYDSLPTLRLQSRDGAEDGDRLGRRWSVHFRALEWDGAVRIGADWTRRGPSSIEGPRPQEQSRLDHGLAFITIGGPYLRLTAAYLRDERRSSAGPTATDRAQMTLQSEWTLSESWRLSAGIWAQYDDQSFGDRTGTSLRAEPWLDLRFSSRGFHLELTGKALTGFVSADGQRQIDGVRPQAAVTASGPLVGALGWNLALQLNSHLPQPWNLPQTSDGVQTFETSWGATAGTTWRGDRGELQANLFYQRVRDYWARPVVIIDDRQDGRFEVFGVELDAAWRPLPGLDLRANLGWAEDILMDTSLEPIRPAGAKLRGLISVRYAFGIRRGFVEFHTRWITDTLAVGEQPRLNTQAGDPVRVGLMGGVDLGRGLSLLIAVENMLDAAYDDPMIDRDHIGLDARIALSFTSARL